MRKRKIPFWLGKNTHEEINLIKERISTVFHNNSDARIEKLHVSESTITNYHATCTIIGIVKKDLIDKLEAVDFQIGATPDGKIHLELWW